MLREPDASIWKEYSRNHMTRRYLPWKVNSNQSLLPAIACLLILAVFVALIMGQSGSIPAVSPAGMIRQE